MKDRLAEARELLELAQRAEQTADVTKNLADVQEAEEARERYNNFLNPGPSHHEASASALQKQISGTHYKSLPIQPVEYCQRNGLKFCESSAIKYITRHREKNGKQDILKAIHFLELLLELEYPEPKQ